MAPTSLGTPFEYKHTHGCCARTVCFSILLFCLSVSLFHLPFHFNRVHEGLCKKDAEEKREEISLQQLGASPLRETI